MKLIGVGVLFTSCAIPLLYAGAQTCALSGTVSDAKSGELLQGAQVSLAQTKTNIIAEFSHQEIANAEGKFCFVSDLPLTGTIVVTYPGYAPGSFPVPTATTSPTAVELKLERR